MKRLMVPLFIVCSMKELMDYALPFRFGRIPLLATLFAVLFLESRTHAQNATQEVLVVTNGGYVLNLPYAAAMTQAAVQELVASVNNKTILAAEVGAVVFTSVNAAPYDAGSIVSASIIAAQFLAPTIVYSAVSAAPTQEPSIVSSALRAAPEQAPAITQAANASLAAQQTSAAPSEASANPKFNSANPATYTQPTPTPARTPEVSPSY
jgi:hypothetical protein